MKSIINIMKIITTPMCEEVVKLAGVTDYLIDKFPDNNECDLAVVLSESKVKMPHISIKINTASQIFKSIKKISSISNSPLTDSQVKSFFTSYPLCLKYLNPQAKNNIPVKVYSNFLKDIAEDVGFSITNANFQHVIYPDYLKDKVTETNNLLEIPSHNSISKNPFKKAEFRYSILESLLL